MGGGCVGGRLCEGIWGNAEGLLPAGGLLSLRYGLVMEAGLLYYLCFFNGEAPLSPRAPGFQAEGWVLVTCGGEMGSEQLCGVLGVTELSETHLMKIQ